MKFARYLQDTQTPEWKKAYIDYRYLKKKIGSVKTARENYVKVNDSPSASRPSLAPSQRPQSEMLSSATSQESLHLDSGSEASIRAATSTGNVRPSLKGASRSFVKTMAGMSPRGLLQRKSTSFAAQSRRSGLPQPYPPTGPIPLRELYPHLSKDERAFFAALDAELEKVETFYLDRQEEMKKRSAQLRLQLAELANHREAYHATYPDVNAGWTSALTDQVKVKVPRFILYKGHDAVPDARELREELSTDKGKGKEATPDSESTNGLHESTEQRHAFDPENYVRAKKKLKKAMLEHYRGLELLQNYRILNVTGFRKAVKKFEKVTKIPAQHSYMAEKVNTSALGSGDSVKAMLAEAEDLFAQRFEYGSKKKALQRLRAESLSKSHHLSTFRSGFALGLAVPALISGIHQSYQHETREAIPSWGALLYVYATFMVPTVFSLLVGINIVVWTHFRINYVFIFELDVRTRLDPREYFETPAILLSALCYAFWLSFSRIGHPSISPTAWPLAWLILTIVILIDPLPLYFKTSRYWMLKNTARLLLSGTRRVEFTDFWLGDQFCSLTFTLANLYFVGCVYERQFSPNWNQVCGSKSQGWATALALSVLPLVVRLVQCIRRYADSKLFTHLINAGKYATGTLALSFYYTWRHQGQGRGTIFVLWCLTNTLYSLYAGTWDFLMDWSVLQPNAKRKFLRSELVYSDYVLWYYFAIVSNAILRFLWVIYIPVGGPNPLIRSFIAAMLEMLRRWQWNFFRVEAEFVGHMDQFRITRDIPLPYSFGEDQEDELANEGLMERCKQLFRSFTRTSHST